MTSLAFMFIDVPDPLWKRPVTNTPPPTRNCSSWSPSATSSAAAAIASRSDLVDDAEAAIGPGALGLDDPEAPDEADTRPGRCLPGSCRGPAVSRRPTWHRRGPRSVPSNRARSSCRHLHRRHHDLQIPRRSSPAHGEPSAPNQSSITYSMNGLSAANHSPIVTGTMPPCSGSPPMMVVGTESPARLCDQVPVRVVTNRRLRPPAGGHWSSASSLSRTSSGCHVGFSAGHGFDGPGPIVGIEEPLDRLIRRDRSHAATPGPGGSGAWRRWGREPMPARRGRLPASGRARHPIPFPSAITSAA